MIVKINKQNLINEEEFDLFYFIGVIRDNKWIITSIIGLFVIVSIFYILIITPIYQADALIQITNDSQGVPGITDISQILNNNNVIPHSITEIAIINSRSVMQNTVKELGLSIRIFPYYFPKISLFLVRFFQNSVPEKIKKFFLNFCRYKQGNELLSISVLEVPDRLLEEPLQLVANGNNKFQIYDKNHNLLITGNTGNYISRGKISILVKKLNAHPGMCWIIIKQPLLKVTSNLQHKVEAIENGKGSGIIRLTYKSTNPDCARMILEKICNIYLKQNISRGSAEAANSLTFVQSQLPIVRKQLEIAESALKTYQINFHAINIELQTKTFMDQFSNLDVALLKLRLQRVEIARRFADHHPVYILLKKQIEEVMYQKRMLLKEINRLPGTQKELLRLSRDVQVYNQIYTGLLNQAQQLEIAKAGKVGNARLIDQAAVDTSTPVYPQKIFIIIISTILGLLVSIVIVFIRRILNNGIEDPELIEKLGLPVYSSIPISQTQNSQNKFLRKSGLLALSAPSDIAIESLRSLRTSLYFTLLEAKNNILMISGSSPKAGKTFVSSNLAVITAQAGQNILLIDGDLRKGTLHHIMNDNNIHGLSDILEGKLNFQDVIKKSTISGLEYMTRGHIPQNPAELLTHSNLKDFISQISKNYDLIIIDTPPILAVTDAGIIGSYAGTSLIVVRFGLNTIKEISLAQNRFEQNSVKINGAIFNAIKPKSHGYQSYGYYEYNSEKE